MNVRSDDRQRRLAANLVEHVTKAINASPGDRSVLRRSLHRLPEHPSVNATHRIVAPRLPKDADRATERAFYAVAAMIAAQPGNARRSQAKDEAESETEAAPSTDADQDSEPPEAEFRSLGTTLGEAVALGKLKANTTEARLHLLCRQQLDGIHRHLPRTVARLRADLIPVDWTTLLVDLSRWSRDRDRITKRWLQDFYRTQYKIAAVRRKAAALRKDERGTDNASEGETQ